MFTILERDTVCMIVAIVITLLLLTIFWIRYKKNGSIHGRPIEASDDETFTLFVSPYEGWFYFLWARLIGITAIFVWLYFSEIISSNTEVILRTVFQNIDDLDKWFKKGIEVILLSLVWWRAVKVFIFQGSPFLFGMFTYTTTESEKSVGGPLITPLCIGKMDDWDLTREFYYGAVFRGHKSSDKLVRRKTEFLVLALPMFLGRTFMLQNGRISFNAMSHEHRWDAFVGFMKRYPAVRFIETQRDNLEETEKDFPSDVKWV